MNWKTTNPTKAGWYLVTSTTQNTDKRAVHRAYFHPLHGWKDPFRYVIAWTELPAAYNDDLFERSYQEAIKDIPMMLTIGTKDAHNIYNIAKFCYLKGKQHERLYPSSID